MWRKGQLSKSVLLFGDEKSFRETMRWALKRTWTRKRQDTVVKRSITNILEYMGKMMNCADNENAIEFFRHAFILVDNFAIFVAGINKIDLWSENSMYRQVFDQATIIPPAFEKDFKTISGDYTNKRNRKEVLLAAKKFTRWSQELIKNQYGLNRFRDQGFSEMVNNVRY